jgi:hypothetical protein
MPAARQRQQDLVGQAGRCQSSRFGRSLIRSLIRVSSRSAADPRWVRSSQVTDASGPGRTLGRMWVRCVRTMRGDTNSRTAMSLLASPSATRRATSRSESGRRRQTPPPAASATRATPRTGSSRLWRRRGAGPEPENPIRSGPLRGARRWAGLLGTERAGSRRSGYSQVIAGMRNEARWRHAWPPLCRFG